MLSRCRLIKMLSVDIELLRGLGSVAAPLQDVLSYCLRHSSPLPPSILKVMEETARLPNGRMAIRPDVISLNMMLLKIIRAGRVSGDLKPTHFMSYLY